MKRLSLVLALLVPGCMDQGGVERPRTPQEERARENARKAFDTWNDALAKGDSQATYVGMSAALRSDWLWRRMQDRYDTITAPHMDKLDADTRRVLEKWYAINEQHKPERAYRLPDSFLTSQWLFELYHAHFEQVKAFAMGQAKMRKVVETYADGVAVTIMTDTSGHKEMYELVLEGDGFKVNLSREPSKQ